MAADAVAAATEQELLGGGADVDGDGFLESYDDESYDDESYYDDHDDHDDDDDDTCGGGGECGGASHKEAESTAGRTSPLPQTFELNEIIVPGFHHRIMWMRDEYFRVERPFHGRVRRVHHGDAKAAAR